MTVGAAQAIDERRIYSLRTAAGVTGQSLSSLRKRADRGTMRVVLRDGQRYVAHSELERLNLLPDARLRQIEREVEMLRGELARHRQLAENVERDRDATVRDLERAQEAVAEANARRQAAEQLADAPWWRRRRLRREYRQTLTA